VGGLIAQAVAIRARPRIRSLTLMCTFADGREGSKMSLGMMLRAIRMRVGTTPMRRRDDEPDHAAGVHHGGD
jgi:hypothetical protein